MLLIHAAIERPAVNRIKVATIGWILKIATSVPLNAPNNIATTQLIKNATIIGACNVSGLELVPQSTLRITLPLIAMAAPTLMS